MRRLRSEDGVSAVLVAFSLLMLLAFAGFAVDAGSMFQERRELRRGADAAALGVAAEIVDDVLACEEGAAASRADWYVDQNADDGNSQVRSLVISGGSEFNCSPARSLPAGSPYSATVRVVASAIDASGIPGFELMFMKALGRDRTDVVGAATAAIGPPRSVRGIPYVISDCEWQRVLTGVYAVDSDVVLYRHIDLDEEAELGPEGCLGLGEAGQFLPGGFGWLQASDDCEAELDPLSWSGSDPGVNVPRVCRDELPALLQSGDPIAIPFFDETRARGNGQISGYHIVGWGSFLVTGYDLKPGSPGWSWRSWCADDDPKGPGENVAFLCGRFTLNTAIPEGEFGGEYRGTYLIRLVE